MRAALVVVLMCVVSPALADDKPDIRVHLEIDPQPFILGGYGIQPGIRYNHLRAALGNFRLDVPDLITELGGNDGFHQQVRHSNALYILYFVGDRTGWAFGGSLRLLRLAFTRDGSSAEAKTYEFGPEAIAGYKWHPTKHGFYVMPWVAAGVTLYRKRDAIVDGEKYEPLPVNLFATVNIGWEFRL